MPVRTAHPRKETRHHKSIVHNVFSGRSGANKPRPRQPCSFSPTHTNTHTSTFRKRIQEAVEEVAEDGLAVRVPHGRVPLALGVQERALVNVLGRGNVAVVRENPIAVFRSCFIRFNPKRGKGEVCQ